MVTDCKIFAHYIGHRKLPKLASNEKKTVIFFFYLLCEIVFIYYAKIYPKSEGIKTNLVLIFNNFSVKT
jgi:hypothetical protein